jgi:hypothetical protein
MLGECLRFRAKGTKFNQKMTILVILLPGVRRKIKILSHFEFRWLLGGKVSQPVVSISYEDKSFAIRGINRHQSLSF